MKTFAVSYGQDEYRLHLVEVSLPRYVVSTVVNKVCEALPIWLRQWFCEWAHTPADRRLHDSERDLAVIPVAPWVAKALSPDLYAFFEEED
jgi:hypothetical protein